MVLPKSVALTLSFTKILRTLRMKASTEGVQWSFPELLNGVKFKAL